MFQSTNQWIIYFGENLSMELQVVPFMIYGGPKPSINGGIVLYCRPYFVVMVPHTGLL